MPGSTASITWLAPLLVLTPMVLAHCGPNDGRADGDDGGPAQQPDAAPMKQPDDASKQMDDAAMKQQDDAAKQMDDAAGKQPDEGGAKQQDDAATPTGGGGTTTDSGTGTGTPHDPGSVQCNGAPCDVSHGYFCCVAPAYRGTTESCRPPGSYCFGHAIACDEAADCAAGVCCQESPSAGLVGAASCKSSCSAHTCR